MIKDEIKVVVLTSDFQMLLLANKRKAFAEFEQEISQKEINEARAITRNRDIVGTMGTRNPT